MFKKDMTRSKQVLIPKEGIVFLNKDKELGKLADLNFSKRFLEIWLGEKAVHLILEINYWGKIYETLIGGNALVNFPALIIHYRIIKTKD